MQQVGTDFLPGPGNVPGTQDDMQTEASCHQETCGLVGETGVLLKNSIKSE